MRLGRRLLKSKTIVGIGLFLILITAMGIFAPWVSPHDPLETNISLKFQGFSATYPMGTDHLGRCVLSRLIYGVRTTLYLSALTMIGTILIGTVLGLLSGYFKGVVDEIIMRTVDIMLSFPSQIMIFAVIALLGVDVKNVIMATVLVKWAWYARMVRTKVLQFRERNFVLYAKCVGSRTSYILIRHILPNIAPEIAVLATLDMGWSIINISTLSFLGMGVQAPTPEWGAMLSEAKNVMTSNPLQILAPSLAVVSVVSAFNAFGDALRDVLDPKEVF